MSSRAEIIKLAERLEKSANEAKAQCEKILRMINNESKICVWCNQEVDITNPDGRWTKKGGDYMHDDCAWNHGVID